ncbi:MAG: nuclear transport factor 2 family protein [Pseudomonadota bacterium]
MSRTFLFFLSASFCVLGCTPSKASQPPVLEADEETTSQIRQLDADIFEAAFLTCDGDRLREIMADDLEFYHDKYGIIATSVDEFLDGTIPDCLRRQSGELPYLERRSDDDTMVVRKIGEDGLMQMGEHSFWLRLPGEEIKKVETGVYTHLWVRDGDTYKIKRVISYDHIDQ